MASSTIPYELVDDSSNDYLVAGPEPSVSLKGRFKYRLSCILGRAVTVLETRDPQGVDIYVALRKNTASPTSMDDDRMQRLIEDLEKTMRKIAWSSPEGSRKEEVSQEQWDIILVHVSPNIHDAIIRLQTTFIKYIKKFDTVVTQTCGLDDVDEFGCSLDIELGDLIIRLQQLANSYSGILMQQNELIEYSWTLLQRCPAIKVRLRCLLGSTFSNELFVLICELSDPLSAHHTLVRTAATSNDFRTVNIRLGCPPAVLEATCKRPRISTSPQQPQSLQLHTSSPSSSSSSRTTTPPQGTMMDTIRSYLPKEDREVGLLRLQPASKQAVALLIGCLLHNIPVPPGSDTYYLFGFTTCRTKKEENELTDYYRHLLRTSIAPTIVFTSINNALEHGTLSGLLRNKAGQNLDKYFPALQQFLIAQPEKRFSVHRLVQFIRDEINEEPLACLRRDFGFKLCTQREQVIKLRALYAKIIDKAGPGKLHHACTFGRLLDHAIGTLGFVEPSMRRLLQNDYPSPAVGYDNSSGLEAYMSPHFRKTSRK